MPQERAVTIPPNSDPRIIHWPPCTRLAQCGGCCGTDVLECTATRTEPATIQVTIIIESHLSHANPRPEKSSYAKPRQATRSQATQNQAAQNQATQSHAKLRKAKSLQAAQSQATQSQSMQNQAMQSQAIQNRAKRSHTGEAVLTKPTHVRPKYVMRSHREFLEVLEFIPNLDG